MQLDVSGLLERRGGESPVSFSIPGQELVTIPLEVKFTQPVKVEGVLKKDEGDLELIASCSTQVVTPCSRCLKPMILDLACSIQEQFPLKETDAITGNCLDLAEIVTAAVLSFLPMRVVCKDDCEGLCPECGKDLNTGGCGCNRTQIDPRFGQLRALFKLDEEV